MQIDVKYFLLINGLVVGFIAYSMWARSKKKPGPSMLNLRQNEPTRAMQSEGVSPVRELTARFDFKGQNYDAYEVLDVPAGCNETMARNNYIELRKVASNAQKDLLDRAFMEVRKRSS